MLVAIVFAWLVATAVEFSIDITLQGRMLIAGVTLLTVLVHGILGFWFEVSSMMKKKRRMMFGAFLVILLGVWIILNPPGRFGVCTFGVTTYGCILRPISDLQVRCDGEARRVAKTHALKLENVTWLLDPMPSILIIGIGWEGAVHPLDQVKEIQNCEVRILKTGEAITEYNRLKDEGERVAIHVHSTC